MNATVQAPVAAKPALTLPAPPGMPAPTLGARLHPCAERVLPPLAWLPLSLAAFREAQPSAIFVIFITSVWPIIINTAVGVRNVPADYRNVAAVIRRAGRPIGGGSSCRRRRPTSSRGCGSASGCRGSRSSRRKC